MKCVKSIFCGAIILMAMEIFAAPYVTNVVAKQRYPWGIVDISCEVKGVEAKDKGLEFTIDAVSSNSGIASKTSHVYFRGDNASELEVTTNGVYRFVWDTNKDIGICHNNNMIIRVSILQAKVQLWEDGPYWATRNIGANEPWEYGYYFWWGDTVGYKRENDKWVANDGSNSDYSFAWGAPTYSKSDSELQSKGWITAEGFLTPEHDAAQVHWGGKWRMPTSQEFEDLYSKCDWVWEPMNGVNGYVVRGRGIYASNSIFLPCAGTGENIWLRDVGSRGSYWTSIPNSSSTSFAYSLYFLSDDLSAKCNSGRDHGLPVRPLQGFTK
jgi:hypothetical protein